MDGSDPNFGCGFKNIVVGCVGECAPVDEGVVVPLPSGGWGERGPSPRLNCEKTTWTSTDKL